VQPPYKAKKIYRQMRCVLNRFLRGTCVISFVLAAFGAANAQDFNGFYVGANAGGAFGHADTQLSTVFSPTGYFAATSVPAIATVGHQKIEPNGFSVGGGAGFGHQWDNFYFGLEADFQTMNLSGSATGSAVYPCCAPTAFTITQTVKTNWLFTIRPRVGWVFGNKVLLYQTVGAAFTSVKYTGLFTDTFATAHESASFDEGTSGYAVGGGMEVKLSHHISVKGEYLYMGFGTADLPSADLTAFTPPIPFPTNVFQHSVDLKAQVARGGINFRF
jgi:outer membrane immunogenic protein